MSFAIALSGINAVNSELETISNNIANVGTYGYKSNRTNFASMVAGTMANGVEVSSTTQSIGVAGSLLSTGSSMDVAIDGRGFFAAKDDTGQIVYSRVGSFGVDADGYVVDSFGRRVQGYGVTLGTDTLGALGDLQVPNGQIAASASTELDFVGNLSADWTTPTVSPFDATDALSYNASQVSVVYDSLGTQHTVTQYFVKSATNEVSVYYSFDGTDTGVSSVLQFDTAGKLTSPTAAVNVALGTPAGADALAIDIDYTGTTQYAGDTTTSTNSANGYASGTLIGTSISEDGSIMAEYSNGQSERVGVLALATFPNESALVAVSDTSWTASLASGAPLYTTPGVGTSGTLTAQSLEQSNVDVTSELVDLMTAQRNYQANTKVLTTENEVLQSLMQAL